MIERQFELGAHHGRYILTPQRSASWRQNLYLVGAVAAAAVPIAVAWAVAGYWLILPLCGLELLALTAGLYVTSHALLAREVITLQGDTITIEAGRRRVERRFDLQRAWAQVSLLPEQRLAPSRLVLRSHGRAIELGRFLTDSERREFAGDLRQTL
jgi:uncharacterized membrane protein